MSLSRTSRLSDASASGHGTGSWVSGSFTPSANSLLVVSALAVHSAGSGVNIGDDLTLSGGGLTFTKRVIVNDTSYWGAGVVIFTAPVGASPSSMTLTFDCGANNIDVYGVHAVDYTGYDTSTPTGATASSTAGATDGAGSITLSAAPATDSEVWATLHGESVAQVNGATEGSGWTEVYDSAIDYAVFETQIRTGSTSTSVAWTDVSTDASGLYESHMAALEIRAAAGAADPTITDVDTDEIVLDGQTGVAVTGTDLGTTNADRTFTLRQGSTSVPQTETGTGTATAATLTIGIEQSGADIKFGAATLRATRTSDSAFGDLALTVNPPTGQLYVDIGTPNATAANRITAVADIASGDQIQARGVGGGAAPTGLSIATDATWQFSAGNPALAFDVRVWDASDSTWGAWAAQSIPRGLIISRQRGPNVLYHF